MTAKINLERVLIALLLAAFGGGQLYNAEKRGAIKTDADKAEQRAAEANARAARVAERAERAATCNDLENFADRIVRVLVAAVELEPGGDGRDRLEQFSREQEQVLEEDLGCGDEPELVSPPPR